MVVDGTHARLACVDYCLRALQVQQSPENAGNPPFEQRDVVLSELSHLEAPRGGNRALVRNR